jgi:hypothetical protein
MNFILILYNAGEYGGWLSRKNSIALLDLTNLKAEIIDLADSI